MGAFDIRCSFPNMSLLRILAASLEMTCLRLGYGILDGRPWDMDLRRRSCISSRNDVQGLKPRRYEGWIGMTEVMPCYTAFLTKIYFKLNGRLRFFHGGPLVFVEFENLWCGLLRFPTLATKTSASRGWATQMGSNWREKRATFWYPVRGLRRFGRAG